MTLRSKAQIELPIHHVDASAPVFQLWQGLQVQATGGPLNEHHLDSIAEVCRNALSEYSRLICFDFYLKLPADALAIEDNAVPAFLDLLIQQLYADLQKRESNGGRCIHCRVRYLWMKMPVGSREDYRILLLLNSDAYFGLGKKYQAESCMIDQINDAWMKVTGCDCWEIAMLVNFPSVGCWQFNSRSGGVFNSYEKLLYQASAFACAADDCLRRSFL